MIQQKNLFANEYIYEEKLVREFDYYLVLILQPSVVNE